MRQAGGSLTQASSAIENGARALAALAASAQLDARLKPYLAEASSALLAHAGALTQISRGVSGL